MTACAEAKEAWAAFLHEPDCQPPPSTGQNPSEIFWEKRMPSAHLSNLSIFDKPQPDRQQSGGKNCHSLKAAWRGATWMAAGQLVGQCRPSPWYRR